MTKTLTTERLREIAEHRSPSLRWGEAEKIVAELLAIREAQPVAAGKFAGWGLYHAGSDDFGSWLKHRPEDDRGDAITKHGYVNVKLYTAPPAPAVPDAYCIMPLTLTAANGAKGALSGEFKVSRTVRCHECGGEGCDDCADAGEFEEEITVPWDTIKEIYRAAVDACRAAMLAQPVSQGYKLVPVDPTQEMRDAWFFMEDFDTEWKAMLAAAPEITPITDKRQTIADEMNMGSRLTKHRFSLDNTTNNTETNNNE